jgi:hypothetical protein
LLIRVLHGKTSRGHFVGGRFHTVRPSKTAKKAA